MNKGRMLSDGEGKKRAENKRYLTPLSRHACIGVIKGQKDRPIGPEDTEKLANYLTRTRNANYIRKAIEAGLQRFDDDSEWSMDSTRSKPISVPARSGRYVSTKIAWPLFRGFIQSGKKDRYWEVEVSFVIVLCQERLGSKLWVSTRVTGVHKKGGKEFRLVSHRFSMQETLDFWKRTRDLSESVSKMVWPFYKRAAKNAMKRDSEHECWLICQGANTIEPVLLNRDSRPQLTLDDVNKKTDGFEQFKQDFYVRAAQVYEEKPFRGKRDKLFEFFDNSPVRIYNKRDDFGIIAMAPPVENVFRSAQNPNKKVPAFMLVGVSSCQGLEDVEDYDNDCFALFSSRAVARYSSAF